MKKFLILLCVLISSCNSTDIQKQSEFIEKQINTFHNGDKQEVSIEIPKTQHWDYIVIVEPLYFYDSLTKETGWDIAQNKQTSDWLKANLFDKKESFPVLIFLKKNELVFKKTLRDNFIQTPFDRYPSVSYSFVSKDKPKFILKKVGSNIVVFGSDKYSQAIYNEPTIREINEEQYKKYKNSGSPLKYMDFKEYPDISTPENLIKTFFKARLMSDIKALESCLHQSKEASIFLDKEKNSSINLVEIQKLEGPRESGYQTNIFSTHRVIITAKRKSWYSEEIVDTPYSYYIRQIGNKWQIVGHTIDLSYD